MNHPPLEATSQQTYLDAYPDATPGFMAAKVMHLRMRIEDTTEQHNRHVDNADAGDWCNFLRGQIRRLSEELYQWECAAHRAGVVSEVTALSPEQLDAVAARNKATVDKLHGLPVA